MSIELEDELKTKLLNLKFNDVLEDMRAYAKENDVPIIQDEGLAFLKSLIGVKKPLNILEIGTAIGYSSSIMALSSNAHVYTIERDPKMEEQAIKNIKLLNVEDKVHLIFKDALEAFDDVSHVKFDIIFIDAAKAQYTKFFNIYTPLLKDDGIVISDNMLFHGITIENAKSRALRALIRKLNDYQDFLLNLPDYETSIFNIGDGMAVSVKKA